MGCVLLPLAVSTLHAELVEQLRLARVNEFAAGTSFRTRSVGGRRYWYAQPLTGPEGRT